METVVGVFAHVDAGKTTLSEQLLYRGGTLRRAGRVDSGDTCLDHDVIERGTHDELLALKGTYYQLYTGALELD